MIKEREPFSIRASIWLAIVMTVASIVLGTAALYGYQLYQSRQETAHLQTQTLAQAYAAQIAPKLWAEPRKAVADSVEQLPWHPSMCLMAILDKEQRPVVIRGSAQLLDWYLQTNHPDPEQKDIKTWSIPNYPQQPLPALNLAAVPIQPLGAKESPGTLVCAARSSNESMLANQEVWAFFASLMLMAATGILLGTSYLRLSVIEPLALLRSQSAKSQEQPKKALPTHRCDEIGDLAKLLTDLYGDVEQWRDRTTELQTTFAQRVDSETAHMTRELKRVKHKVWTDPLTKLGNRRLLDDKFVEIFSAQKEADEDFSLVMIDVDNFKTLNDTLGHKAGDELLQFMGELLRQCVRAEDLAIRLGGDEFTLLLPGTSAKNARTMAERMSRLFAQKAILFDVETKPAVSIGIASLRAHYPQSAEQLIHLADVALYAAKRAGKSQTVVYSRELEAVSAA